MILGVEGLTPAAFAGVSLVAAIGATLQGAVGFGMGMFVVPILVVIDPAWVPGPTLSTMALLTVAMTLRERRAVAWRELGFALSGRVPGVIAALAFLTLMPASALGPVFGILVLVAVGLSVSGWQLRPAPRTLVGAGALSGFMGTSVSIGGPPMALLYQHETGPRVRATLSAFFTFGVAISLVGLTAIGRFGLGELARVGALLPGTAVGFLLSGRLHGLLDRGYLRTAILVLAAVMGFIAIARSILP